MTFPWESRLHQALEAARSEVVRRMRDKGHPFSVVIERSTLVDMPERNGWQSGTQRVQVSRLWGDRALLDIGDDTVADWAIGLRGQLGEIANELHCTTDLGARALNMWPAATDADGVLVHYLVPLALHYLYELTDLSVPDPAIAGRLVGELASAAASPTVSRVRQIALAGVLPEGPLAHDDVRFRPLTGLERGLFLDQRVTRAGDRRPLPKAAMFWFHSLSLISRLAHFSRHQLDDHFRIARRSQRSLSA